MVRVIPDIPNSSLSQFDIMNVSAENVHCQQTKSVDGKKFQFIDICKSGRARKAALGHFKIMVHSWSAQP